MSDDFKSMTADWEPGTLEKTRKNIGDLSESEAREMSQKLGGQVLYEKSSPASSASRSTKQGTGRIIRNTTSSAGDSSMNKTSSTGSGVPTGGRRRNQETLPAISKKSASLINKTMMSYEY